MQVYRIAGLCLGFEGVQAVEPSSAWQKFAADGKADILFRVCYAERLPSATDAPYFCGEKIRRYRTDSGQMRIYSDPFTHRDTVAVTESDDGAKQDLVISAHRHPWGSTAEQLFEVLDLPRLFLARGRLVMHGAYVTHEGRAILFTAPSGVGKSTQAALWREHCGAKIVNGDRILIGFEGDQLMAYGFPFSGSSDECENVTARVACIVSLSQARENRLQRLEGKQALREFLRGVYSDNGAEFSKQLQFALAATQSVPIYHLACLPNESAVDVLRQGIE